MNSRCVIVSLLACLAACHPPPTSSEPEPDAPPSCVIPADRAYHQTSEVRELKGCREVSGDLFIQDAGDLADLESLSELEVVRGHLDVIRTGVKTLDGLRSLRRVEGRLRIEQNDKLVRMDGLHALESVGQGVSIYRNDLLKTIEGWGALVLVGAAFEVVENASVERLLGFDAVTGMHGLVVVNNLKLSGMEAFAGLTTLSFLDVSDNYQLVVLKGLNALRSLEDSAHLRNNPMLSRWELLSSLRSVEKDLLLENLPALTRLEGLRNLQTVGLNLSLSGLGVTHLGDLTSLTRVGGSLTLRDNAQLTTLQGLETALVGSSDSCGETGGVLVRGNPVLRNLDGLNPVQYSLSVLDNPLLERLTHLTPSASSTPCLLISGPKLQSLAGLEQLTSLRGFSLVVNRTLARLDGLEALTRVTWLSLRGDLVSLEGLSGLREVAGSMYLAPLVRLKTLHGLEGLTKVTGQLHISAPAITSLAGLDSLARIDGGLMISECHSLERLTGLEALRSLSKDYEVSSNWRLPSCEAEGLLQRLRASGYTGTSRISRNEGAGTCP